MDTDRQTALRFLATADQTLVTARQRLGTQHRAVRQLECRINDVRAALAVFDGRPDVAQSAARLLYAATTDARDAVRDVAS